jgi:4-diphosphocytidyl-2-C-methyl-D-erythritol kinase
MLGFPNVKINIGLCVTGKRSDGYHNLETVFCPAGLSDILEFVPLPNEIAGNASFASTGIPVGCHDEDNLCLKAYRLLNRDFPLPAISIHLHKIVPPGAGLGGGSSDAAWMLKSLNTVFELKLDEERLCDYASELGSDCAFFIKDRPLFGYERGNRFHEIPSFPTGLEAVIVNPGIHISTAEAFSGIRPAVPDRSLKDLIGLPVFKWKDFITNDFEKVIIPNHPVIGEIKARMYDFGAIYASMSGSGSSVYGIFQQKAPAIQNRFPGFFVWSGPLG